MIPYSTPKCSDLYTLSQRKLLENHTLHGGTYLYSPYRAVPPPPPGLPSAWYYYIQLRAKTQSKTLVKLKPSKSPDKNRVPVFYRLGPGRSWLLLTWDKVSWRGKMANNKQSANYRKKTGEREWSGLLNPLHSSPLPSRSPHYSPFSPNRRIFASLTYAHHYLIKLIK